MGLTQPVFPKVDRLGQTADKLEYEAITTHREEENATSYEAASFMGQT